MSSSWRVTFKNVINPLKNLLKLTPAFTLLFSLLVSSGCTCTLLLFTCRICRFFTVSMWRMLPLDSFHYFLLYCFIGANLMAFNWVISNTWFTDFWAGAPFEFNGTLELLGPGCGSLIAFTLLWGTNREGIIVFFFLLFASWWIITYCIVFIIGYFGFSSFLKLL